MFLLFFVHKVYSRSFITLRLSHWCHMGYFIDVLTSFLGLECGSCSLCRFRKLSDFTKQYLNLCSRWTKVVWVWKELINDRIFIFGWTILSKAVHIKNDNYNDNNTYFICKNHWCKRIAECSPHHTLTIIVGITFKTSSYSWWDVKTNPSESTGLWSIQSRRQNCSVAKSAVLPRNWATLTLLQCVVFFLHVRGLHLVFHIQERARPFVNVMGLASGLIQVFLAVQNSWFCFLIL